MYFKVKTNLSILTIKLRYGIIKIGENRKCVVLGCIGIVDTDKYSNKLNDKVKCNKCGIVHTKGEKFCAICGEGFSDESVILQDINYEEYYALGNKQHISNIAIFIGKKSSYYLNQFNRLKDEDRIISWNWGGMIFGAYWFAYRKMYFYVILYIVIELLGDYFIDFTYGIFSYILTIISGLFGNYLYMRHIEKTVEKYESIEMSRKEDYIKQYGGTGKYGVIFVIFVAILVYIKYLID